MDKEKKEEKNASLEDVAINIKGKKYVLVSDRVKYFAENYPNGGIETTILSNVNDERIVIKAIVTPDWEKNPSRRYTGHSQAVVGDGYINKTSALENAETSAIGRALGMLGIGVIDSIASVDEINKAEGSGGKATKKEKSPDYDRIKPEEQEEAKAISEMINKAENVEQLKDMQNSIKRSGTSKEVMQQLILDYNRKMRQLKKEEKENAEE
jgi:hypothetical protein